MQAANGHCTQETKGRASSHSVGATKGRDMIFYETMARETLDNLTMIFWEAEDDALMEEFTIIESLMISRFGLSSDDRGMNVEFRTMETYGIFAVNHGFFPRNDKVAINDVQGSLSPNLLLRWLEL
jgi:hypothetical protein